MVEDVTKKRVPAYQRSIVLEICANDANDEDVDVPYVRYELQ